MPGFVSKAEPVSFDVSTRRYFRFFRLTQIGPNTASTNYQLTLYKFEFFGKLRPQGKDEAIVCSCRCSANSYSVLAVLLALFSGFED
jgi:hypothetical protein